MKKNISFILIWLSLVTTYGQDTLVQKKIFDYSIIEVEKMKSEAITIEDVRLENLYSDVIRKMTKLDRAEKEDKKLLINIFKHDLRNLNGLIIERFEDIEHEKEKKKRKEEIKNFNEQIENGSIVLSKLSVGGIVYSLADFNNPDNQQNKNFAPGLGLEFNLNYYFSKSFNVSGFIRLAGIFNRFIFLESGSVYNATERVIDDYATGGVMLEYRFFKWFAIDIKTGVEKLTNYPKKAAGIFGGGLSFYVGSFNQSRLQQSFRIGVYKSNNQTGVRFNPYPTQEVYYGDAIIYELGYRIQFRKVR